ncbi:aspartyl protease APCB1-like [Tripterygium wilfordii]|uniref:aspartyl protease APCB1-like n=1 Tax=Tripterygium wilfordii TaxID=458696 RepID=UPI0018F8305A|nr:aspartyl protease APCB1-like [Tripterygium wilfordii]
MMQGKRLAIVMPPMMMIVVLICILFEGSFSEATSSLVFPLSGNVWAYFVNISIRNQAEPFQLHVDTGSDLTWVKCVEPCQDCTQPQESLYNPPKDSIVQCGDPLCAAIPKDKDNCENPTDRCEYVYQYDDDSSTEGYLVRDHFHLLLINGSVIHSPLVFGCGYKQTGTFKRAGIVGLGKGPIGFLSQLHSQGLIQQVTGHCLNSRGGGYLFLGADLVPPLGVSWTPITNNDEEDYITGQGEILFAGSPTQVGGLQFKFDSGSTLTYLNQPDYQFTLNRISQALEGTPLIHANPINNTLRNCWKHKRKPITSFDDVNNYFMNLTLSFTNVPNAKLNLPLQAYLILARGKVCLAISNGGQTEGENSNVIGAVSMQDKLMIYDNIHHRIGWASSSNCDSVPWR